MSFLRNEPLDLSRLVAQVSAPERGAVVSFLGVVRNHHAGRRVQRLEYSAYDAMVEAELSRIVREARARWDAIVALEHRTGMLEIGEPSVAIAAAAPHRDAAFAACRYVIEEVKRRAPIWKREHYEDGSTGWVAERTDRRTAGTAKRQDGVPDRRAGDSADIEPAPAHAPGQTDWGV